MNSSARQHVSSGRPKGTQRRAQRIAFYYPRALVGDGGPTLSTRGWAAALSEAGRDVTVLFDEYRQAEIPSGVRWVHLPHRKLSRVRLPSGLQSVVADHDL